MVDEEKGKEKPSIAMTAEQLMQALQTVLQNAQNPSWKDALNPLAQAQKEDPSAKYVVLPSDATDAKKKLLGFATGTFLDELFLDENGNSIKGIPMVAQIGITGLPSSGKSVVIEEIAVRVSSAGIPTMLVTSEDRWNAKSERFDLQSRCKQKADILGLDWAKIQKSLFVLDVAEHAELREWETFGAVYKALIENKGIKLVLVDSVTCLEDYRGALKYRLHEMGNYNQAHGVTGIYVNQRAVEEADAYNIAGGIGLAHNFDSVIIIDYTRAYHMNLKFDTGAHHQDPTRFVRVLGCRMCNFDGHYFRAEISGQGFLKILPKLQPEPEVEKPAKKTKDKTLT